MFNTQSRKNARLYLAFVGNVLTGRPVQVPIINRNVPGDVSGWRPESLVILVEEGRRQLDSQRDRLRHTTERAQVLLGISLALLGFGVSVFEPVLRDADGIGRVAVIAAWAVGFAVSLLAVAGAAASIVSRADLTTIDATRMSTWEEPVISQLAADYATAVILGENTVAARALMLRMATRVTVVAAFLLVAARVAAEVRFA